MKAMVFEVVSESGKYLILGLEKLRDITLVSIAWIYSIIIWITANIFKFILGIIDSERLEHAEQASEQYSMTRELEILGAISAIKEDVLAQKTWTNEHSEKLNELGSQLLYECEWEDRRIHRYMKKIVESIPGLQYAGHDDEDDDEDIRIGV